MRLTLFGIFLLLAISTPNTSCSNEEGNRTVNNSVIYLLLEMFRGLIINGDTEKDLPKSDPLIFDLNTFSLDGLFTKGEINATNAILSGLGRFNINNVDFSVKDVAVNIEVTIPTLKLEADYYELDGNIYGVLPFSGSGVFYVIAKDVILNTKVYFKQSDNGKYILIHDLENTSFTISKIVSLTEYDKHIDHIINAILEEVLPSKLSRFSRYIAATYQDYLLGALNPMLSAYETWSILATIL